MDQDRHSEIPDRLDEISKYFSANPTPPEPVGGQHIHVHHHYAAPVISTEPMNQNPGQSVLEKYTPYFMVFLGGLVIIAGATVILMFAFAAVAMILLVLLGCLAGLVLVGAVAAVIIKSHTEGGALRDLSRAQSKQRRR